MNDLVELIREVNMPRQNRAMAGGTWFVTVNQYGQGNLKTISGETVLRISVRSLSPTKAGAMHHLQHVIDPLTGAWSELDDLPSWCWPGYIETSNKMTGRQLSG